VRHGNNARQFESGAGGRFILPHPSDLSDAEWAILEPLLPEAKQSGRPRRVHLREIVNAIFYIHFISLIQCCLPKVFCRIYVDVFFIFHLKNSPN
jgi:hypothetical protein